mmetsp:Transcript_19814/g.42510  ORF Transcript_19814/g.42510 Transcript_19814/m.42510 type:complete len:643 (+) Transcript_19814:267-2195(+)
MGPKQIIIYVSTLLRLAEGTAHGSKGTADGSAHDNFFVHRGEGNIFFDGNGDRHLRHDDVRIRRNGGFRGRHRPEVIRNVADTPPRGLSLTGHGQDPHHPIPRGLVPVQVGEQQRRVPVHRRVVRQRVRAQVHPLHRVEEVARRHVDVVQLLLRVRVDHEHDVLHLGIDGVQRNDDLLVVPDLVPLPLVAGVVDGAVGRSEVLEVDEVDHVEAGVEAHGRRVEVDVDAVGDVPGQAHGEDGGHDVALGGVVTDAHGHLLVHDGEAFVGVDRQFGEQVPAESLYLRDERTEIPRGRVRRADRRQIPALPELVLPLPLPAHPQTEHGRGLSLVRRPERAEPNPRRAVADPNPGGGDLGEGRPGGGHGDEEDVRGDVLRELVDVDADHLPVVVPVLLGGPSQPLPLVPAVHYGPVGILQVGEVHRLAQQDPPVGPHGDAAHVEVDGILMVGDVPPQPDRELGVPLGHPQRDDVPGDDVGEEQRGHRHGDAHLPLGLLGVVLGAHLPRQDGEPLRIEAVVGDGDDRLPQGIVGRSLVPVVQHQLEGGDVPRARRRGQRVAYLLRVVDSDDVLDPTLPRGGARLLLDGSLPRQRAVVEDLDVRVGRLLLAEEIPILGEEVLRAVDREDHPQAGEVRVGREALGHGRR